MTNLATIGHNNPPSDEEILKEKLKENYSELLAKIDTLSTYKAPETVDAESTKDIADFLDRVKGLKKSVEAAHKKEKDSFLKLGKIVDAFKNTNVSRLDEISREAERKQFAYLQAKADAERERIRLAAEAERLKAEALAEQALAHEREGIADTAGEIMQAAIEHDKLSNRIDNYLDAAKDSKFAKTISASGAVSGLRTAWAGDIIDLHVIDLQKLRPYLKEEHIQMAINAFVKDGGRELSGVKIYQKSTLR